MNLRGPGRGPAPHFRTDSSRGRAPQPTRSARSRPAPEPAGERRCSPDARRYDQGDRCRPESGRARHARRSGARAETKRSGTPRRRDGCANGSRRRKRSPWSVPSRRRFSHGFLAGGWSKRSTKTTRRQRRACTLRERSSRPRSPSSGGHRVARPAIDKWSSGLAAERAGTRAPLRRIPAPPPDTRRRSPRQPARRAPSADRGSAEPRRRRS